MAWPHPKQLVSRVLPSAVRYVLKEPHAMLSGPVWHCPICGRDGRFLPARGRRFALCRHCQSLERHRLLWHVISNMTLPEPVLHLAPEHGISPRLRQRYRDYQTADLQNPCPVDHPGCDLTDMPFSSASFGSVIACHVLEHIQNDHKAIAEIARVLRTGGIAILPVPIVAARTIEYSAPVSTENDHVRAPGADYHDRLRGAFSVHVVTSADVPDRLQTWIYEDRTGWPTATSPYRLAMPGVRHQDMMPVATRL